MTKGYKLLGYKLADNIFYCLHHREIITLRGTRTQVQLRSTMACLLEYLLAHGRERLVSDEELMINVWEKNKSPPFRAAPMAGYSELKVSLTPGWRGERVNHPR